MQWKISSYLYSNVLLRSLSQQLNSVSHFSTIPNRPMRGDRGRRRNEDPSEERGDRGRRRNEDPSEERGDRGRRRNEDPSEEQQFLRNLNFGDTNDREKPHSSRPMRTEQRPPRGIRREREEDVRELDGSFKIDLDDGEKGGKFSFGDTFGSGNPHSGLRNRHMKTEQRPFGGTSREIEVDDKILDGSLKVDDDGDTLLGKLDFSDIGSGNRKEQRPMRDEGTERGNEHKGLDGKLDFSGIGGGNNAKETRKSRSSEPQTTVSETAVEDSEEIFKKMKETGLIPNAVSMLDGLCKDGLLQEAMKLFGAMREKGTIPEVVIYTAVVEGFCRAAKFDDAKRIFRKMQKNEIIPNAFSYGILIQGLSGGNKLKDAMEFCMEMLDAGHVPNAATLAGLVDGFCREKGAEEAESLVRSLKERGFVIDEKAVREHLDKKGRYSPMVWEAIFGKDSKRPF